MLFFKPKKRKLCVGKSEACLTLLAWRTPSGLNGWTDRPRATPLIRDFAEEIRGHEATLASQFSEVKAVVVHVAVNVDDVTGPERQLHLEVYVRRQFVRVIIVERDHLFHGRVGVNVAPSVTCAGPTVTTARSAPHTSRAAGAPVIFEELLHHALVLDLHLGHHVAGHVTGPLAALAPVETISVFVANDLEN